MNNRHFASVVFHELRSAIFSTYVDTVSVSQPKGFDNLKRTTFGISFLLAVDSQRPLWYRSFMASTTRSISNQSDSKFRPIL